MKTKTRVYAIIETDDVHDISNEDFMDEAEGIGYVWSLLGFQNCLNGEGGFGFPMEFNEMHFRFIDVEVSKWNN